MNTKRIFAIALAASRPFTDLADGLRPVSAPPEAVGCEYAYDAKASDAFDGDALDAAKWNDWIASFQGRSRGFLFARDNVAVSNGCLNLTARLLRPEEKTVENLRRGFDTYATALVRAREKTFYGYYECRAKSMRACVCNAFWLYDPLSDQPQKKFRPGDFTEEIDIFELFGKASPRPPAGDVTRKCYTTAHRLKTPYLEGIVNSGVCKLENKSAATTVPFDFWDGYHTYGFRWTPTDLTWYADGVELFSRTNDFFHRPMHVTFDCEIMYDWSGEPDRADLPQTFSIDYFRHWRLTDAKPFEATVRGMGTVEFSLAGGERLAATISYPDRGPNRCGVQNDEHTYISYGDRVRRMREHKPLPSYTPVSNCVVRLTAPRLMKETALFLLPYFHSSYGLYSHADIVKSLPFWRSVYPLAPERAYTLRFEPDALKGRTLVYLDGSVLAATNAVLDVVSAATRGGLALVSSGRCASREANGQYRLPKLALPSRASDLLKEGATLSLAPGLHTIEGVPVDVWSVADSIDQGRHHRTSSRRGLCADPQYDRTPWKTGFEYMQWRVPGRTWSHAWVLCADVPQDGREPVVGVQLSKLGQGCTGGNIDAESASLDGAKTVGTLTYGDGRTSPLKLVRVDLDHARLGARGNGQSALDFEFTGGGAMGSATRSSVQVFGCTLVEAPYTFEVANPVRGNVFEQGTDEQRCGFAITANNDDVSSTMEYEIYDPLFKTLDKGVKTFAMNRRGDTTAIALDLSAYGVGWYGMDFVFKDAVGKVLFRHEAAFTVLAPDTREAGYESPYAAWPHSKGYHGSNPDPMGPRTVMRKAGYRNSWEPPVASEEEGRPWKIGLNTLGYRCCQPGGPTKTHEEFEARLDRQVELVRQQAEAFPHAQVVQLLHEQGGRQISTEVATGTPGVRGEYRGWDFATGTGDWEVFYCTEWAKRIRREFPGKKIMIGNGSSSCEKVASLVRRGFDLNLVDQLGIESKGFGTMPEYCANQESPGMLWALRETGRAFGYTNFTLNACNEYVFRTERTVGRDWPKRKIMSVTDFTLRDYLISMAHGCTIISTGHLEDAADAYYDTNWGAGGQCKAYPYSYPKRMFTALAVLTRVIDCPEFLRRVPTGDNTAIVFEFRRNRKVKDYAYALWTPTHDAVVEVAFPKGAAVTLTETFGTECAFATNRLVIGSSPRYLVSSAPVEFVKVVDYLADAVPADAREIFRPTAESLVQLDEAIQDRRGYWGVPNATNGTFIARTVRDAKLGDVFEVEHVKDGRRIPAVIWEGRNYGLAKPVKLRLSELRGFGLWIRGNGSYGKVKLLLSKPDNKYLYEIECGNRGYITFGGWQYVDMDLSEWTPACGWLKGADEVTLEKIQIGTTRVALDPIEMRPTVGDVAIGPVYALPKAGVSAISVEEEQSRRAWENTDDKDR